MTTLPHDDVDPSAVEDAVARLEPVGTPTTHPRSRHLAAVTAAPVPPPQRSTSPAAPGATDPAAGRAAGRATDRALRLRLVPALPETAPTPASAHRAPALLRERARALAPAPRVHLDEQDEDRGAAPSTDAGRFAHGVGLACVEVVLGRRPVAQLARWVTPQVLDALQVRADLVRRAGVLAHARRPAARRVRVCPVDSHAAEACLVVEDGVRVRAVALRLEAHRGAWRVATLQIG